MNKTEFFRRSYPKIAKIYDSMSCNVLVTIKNLVPSDVKIICDDVFDLTLCGPFITFEQTEKELNTLPSQEFYIFTPLFMVQNKFRTNILTMTPMNSNANATVELEFKNNDDCKSILTKIRKVRKNLIANCNSLPPILASVKVYSLNDETENKYEFSLMSDTVLLQSSHKNQDPPPTRIEANTSIIPTFDMLNYNDENKMRSFWLRSSKQNSITITFENFDLMAMCFLSIYASIEKKASKSMKKSYGPELAKRIMPIQKNINLLCFSSPMVIEEPRYKVIESLNTEMDTVSMNNRVRVPKKTSSHLEVLLFEKRMKRNIFICSPREKLVLTHEKQITLPETSFDKEIIAIKAEKYKGMPLINAPKEKTKLFSPKADFFLQKLETDGTELLKQFIDNPIASKETWKFMESVNFEVPKNVRPVAGIQIAYKITELIDKIKVNSRSDKNFINFCTFLCSLLVEERTEDFYKVLSELCHFEISDFPSLTVFISKLLFKGKLYRFMALFNTERFKNLYKASSMMRNREFMELFIGSLAPIAYRTFSGAFSAIQSPVSIPIRRDINCRMLTDTIFKANARGEEISKKILAEIVSHTFQFLKENYRGPQNSIFEGMRSPLYAFQIACNNGCSTVMGESTDIIALRAAVSKITAEPPKFPLCTLIINGLIIGMLWKWFIRAIRVCIDESLCTEDSAFYDIEQVTNFADCLNSLSSILLEASPEELLEFDFQFG